MANYEVNAKNDRLLFDYASNRIGPEKSKEIESMIRSNPLWMDYYLDMKRLYDNYGDRGLEVASENSYMYEKVNNDLLNSICTYETQLNGLIQFYRTSNKSDNNQKALVVEEIVEIGEVLLNMPEFDLVEIQSEYMHALNLVISSINEIIDNNHLIENNGGLDDESITEYSKIEESVASES